MRRQSLYLKEHAFKKKIQIRDAVKFSVEHTSSTIFHWDFKNMYIFSFQEDFWKKWNLRKISEENVLKHGECHKKFLGIIDYMADGRGKLEVQLLL